MSSSDWVSSWQDEVQHEWLDSFRHPIEQWWTSGQLNPWRGSQLPSLVLIERRTGLHLWEPVCPRQRFDVLNATSQYVFYLQDLNELLYNDPLLIIHLVFTHVICSVSTKAINGLPILQSKMKHVVCRIPACSDVSWYHPNGEPRSCNFSFPGWFQNSGGVDNSKSELSKLDWVRLGACFLNKDIFYLD